MSSVETSASEFDSNSSDDGEVINEFNNSKFHEGLLTLKPDIKFLKKL